jgi:hypothetical protein
LKSNLLGMRFGRLTAIEDVGKIKGVYSWKCLCDCGNYTIPSYYHIKSGHTRSCGCLERTWLRDNYDRTTHGHTCKSVISPTYKTWNSMKVRCSDKRTNGFDLYGGRGIKVCDRWLRFDNFLADMGERPEGKTLDRINSDGNYEPSNCRWSTPREQSRNRKDNRFLFVGGEKIIAKDAAVKYGINYGTLLSRLTKYGWSDEKAVSKPCVRSPR